MSEMATEYKSAMSRDKLSCQEIAFIVIMEKRFERLEKRIEQIEQNEIVRLDYRIDSLRLSPPRPARY